jgi:hypothetical protein
MLCDFVRIGGKLAFVRYLPIVIDDADIDAASRDIQPDKMALSHA